MGFQNVLLDDFGDMHALVGYSILIIVRRHNVSDEFWNMTPYLDCMSITETDSVVYFVLSKPRHDFLD